MTSQSDEIPVFLGWMSGDLQPAEKGRGIKRRACRHCAQSLRPFRASASLRARLECLLLPGAQDCEDVG